MTLDYSEGACLAPSGFFPSRSSTPAIQSDFQMTKIEIEIEKKPYLTFIMAEGEFT
jgi:hypothetical protein